MSKPAGTTIHLAEALAAWAVRLDPTAEDLDLAERALLDTMAVTLAARDHPLAQVAGGLQDAARWASIGHVLDFDDLHLPSTAHVSVVCVPAVLASGGDARAYLAAAGVMARLGTALGWEHYARGWHATCTAGAPAAAVGAGLSLGLDAEGLAQAIALAVPAAGGVQRAFGTSAKSLQVGFAAQAGVLAADLVAAGASADPSALDQWLPLVGGDAGRLSLTGPAVPGGLAVKLFPCCYALQRPIGAMRMLLEPEPPPPRPEEVARVVVRTPEAALQPLIHRRPTTGLQGKFSMEYALAATLLDGYPGFASFTDEAARPRRPRRQAGRLRRRRARAAGRADLAGGRAGAPGAAARRSPGPPARALRLRGGVVAVRPLDGITVVSLEQAVAAPFATRQLADLGARVIKVERPGAGDFARTYDESVRGLSSYFVWLNRSKESLTLDVKAPRGRAVLEALLERADVFVQNLGPGAARRLGLGADELEGRFPRLVVCDLSGYGSDGPWADRRAYDLLVQCETGLVSVTGTPEDVAKVGISVADIAAGMYAYSGILTALYQRATTGQAPAV